MEHHRSLRHFLGITGSEKLTLGLNIGHQRRPSRPPIEQEGVGVRCQGRSLQATSPNFAETKRRGGRQGEALQLRSGCQRREPQGHADGRGRGINGVTTQSWFWNGFGRHGFMELRFGILALHPLMYKRQVLRSKNEKSIKLGP
jgi:hypothetical protein